MADFQLIDQVKERIGLSSVDVLSTLFTKASGLPPTTQARRFRADNPDAIDILDDLEHGKQLIVRTSDYRNYRLRIFALPLIAHDRSVKLQKLFEGIFLFFKAHYVAKLEEPIHRQDLIAELGQTYSEAEVLEALYYIKDLSGLWSGWSKDFPLEEDSTISVSEGVLKHRTAAELIFRYFQWHFLSPPPSTSAGEQTSNLPAEPPEIMKNLQWIRQYGREHWVLVLVGILLMAAMLVINAVT